LWQEYPSTRFWIAVEEVMRIARLAALGLAAGLAGCVVHDTPTVNPGYGDGYGNYTRNPPGASTVGEPSPAYVSGMPPEPLYEQMTDAPSDGSVWIDGYWHWNGYEWVWVQGRWEREQQGYVYVEPNYDYVGDQYVYTPGYWSQPERAPRGWNVRDHRDGRPTIIAPPVHSGGYRRPVAVGTRHQVRPPSPGSPGRGDGAIDPHGGRIPANIPPAYDPRGATTWRPGARRPIGVFSPQPTDGSVSGPVRGGTIFTPRGAPPVAAPSTPPPVPAGSPPQGPPQPQVQPAPQPQVQPAPQPVWTPVPTVRQPAPLGRPIYVNPPGPAGDQQRGPRQLGGPMYVQPAGPQVQPAGPQPTTSPTPGNVFRPAPAQAAPPPRAAPPPPPPPPPAPGPRSNNARRPQ
jgi:hypothetical protein